MEQLTEWMGEASCASIGDYLFFAEEFVDRHQTVRARKVCSECPVWQTCRFLGLGEEYGTWGGLTGEDRRRLRSAVLSTGLERDGSHSLELFFRVVRRAWRRSGGDIEKAINMVPLLRDQLAMWSFPERQPNPEGGAA